MRLQELGYAKANIFRWLHFWEYRWTQPLPVHALFHAVACFRETVSKREIQPDLIHLECCPQCPGYVAAITAVTAWFLEVQGIITQATFSYRDFRVFLGSAALSCFQEQFSAILVYSGNAVGTDVPNSARRQSIRLCGTSQHTRALKKLQT